MNYCIKAGIRSGTVCIPSSKSFAHRQLICCALSDQKCYVECDGISKDISATIKCLTALGAKINETENNVLEIEPIGITTSEIKHLYCGESGSTLRFLIPVVGALGVNAVFHMEGRLSERPLDALIDTLIENGMNIVQRDELLYCNGKLKPGTYTIPGNISSQYISGLLFALPLLSGNSQLNIIGTIESADYIAMTEDVIKKMNIVLERKENGYIIFGGGKYKAPEKVFVERDWSNAAFFMCMGALSEKGIELKQMNTDSIQGDMEIINIVRSFGADIKYQGDSIIVKKWTLSGITVDASAIPDLVPTISALACAAEGETRIINAARLRLKESDRLKTTSKMLNDLGGDVEKTQDGLIIHGKGCLSGGEADAANDHRIAMSAAVAACICKSDVIVKGAQCVAKSYPNFWEHLETTEVSK